MTKEQRELKLKTRFVDISQSTTMIQNASRMICIRDFNVEKNRRWDFIVLCIGSKAELTFSFSTYSPFFFIALLNSARPNLVLVSTAF